MNSPTDADRDLQLETTLGRALGIGVVASSICLAAGLLLTLGRQDGGPQRWLLVAGLLLLLATPIARVVVSVVTYAMRRDWIFAALTLIVLLELVASIVVAFRH